MICSLILPNNFPIISDYVPGAIDVCICENFLTILNVLEIYFNVMQILRNELAFNYKAFILIFFNVNTI